MADFADLASETTEQDLAIAMRSRKPVQRPQATGYCLNALCGDELDQYGQLFCCSACALEFEKGRRR